MNPFASCLRSDDSHSLLYEVEWSDAGAGGAILHVCISIPWMSEEMQRESDLRAIEEARTVAFRFSTKVY